MLVLQNLSDVIFLVLLDHLDRTHYRKCKLGRDPRLYNNRFKKTPQVSFDQLTYDKAVQICPIQWCTNHDIHS